MASLSRVTIQFVDYYLIDEDYLFPFAEFVFGFYQLVYAVGTKESNQGRANDSNQPTGVVKCHWHGQDTGAQGALEQVYERLVITETYQGISYRMSSGARLHKRCLTLWHVSRFCSYMGRTVHPSR